MTFQSGQLTVFADSNSPDPSNDRIYVHHKKKMVRIMTSEIRYVEANRAYCRLVTVGGRQFMLSLSLGALERQLPPGNILRIHRSYLINTLHVDQIVEDALLSGRKKLPLSRSCRQALLAQLRIIGKE